jgi:hypothetical protein
VRHKHFLQERTNALFTRGLGVSVLLFQKEPAVKQYAAEALAYSEAAKSRILLDLIG